MIDFLEMVNGRLEICDNCEYYRKNIKQCKICGCFMPLKVSVESMKCPKEKW